jgi:uncharacterized heparinase superfamily protein
MNISRYFHTLRYLRPIQFYGRLAQLLPTRQPAAFPALLPRIRPATWTPPIARQPSMCGPACFSFLGETRELTSPDAWDRPEQAKLWRYNLHYFDDLTARDASDRKKWHDNIIDRWIDENPPTTGTGWEPYPTSLRIVNWVKWSFAGNLLTPRQDLSLAIQARHLFKKIEWHLLGNHLLSNAKALIFAGLYFSGREADQWFRKGQSILAKQLPEQVLADGGHYERSPMYHALLVEDLLDLINLFGAYDRAAPDEWTTAVQKMISWLACMTHPDGGIAFFNDAALGIAPSLADLADYARRLDIATQVSSTGSTHLDQSGYARLQRNGAVLLADIAPVGPDFLPGHAHADTLSFELSLCGSRLFVNSGTSVYGLGEERHRQRSTASHNTLAVDGQNSSEVWSGFRVARRARPFDAAFEDARVSACHDGYRRLAGQPVHCRSWQLENAKLEIKDRLHGAGVHRVDIFFHVHPEWTTKLEGKTEILLAHVAAGIHARLQLDPLLHWRVEPSTWHPNFGASVVNQRIVGEWQGSLPLDITTRMEWSCAS